MYRPASGVLFSQGDRGVGIYILLTGSLAIDMGGQKVSDMDASIGDDGGHPFFGVAGLLEGQPRPFGTSALTPSSVLFLSTANFLELLAAAPSFYGQLSEYAAMRVKSFELSSGSEPTTGLHGGQANNEAVEAPGCGVSDGPSADAAAEASASMMARLEAGTFVQAHTRSMIQRRSWSSREELQKLRDEEDAKRAAGV